MARWLHRVTFTIERAPFDGKDVGDWLLIADGTLSAVEGQPVKYWQIAGDVVSLKDQAGQDQADADEQAAFLADIESDALAAIVTDIDFRSIVIRAMGLTVLDEVNLLRAEHSLAARTKAQLISALDAKIQAGEGRS